MQTNDSMRNELRNSNNHFQEIGAIHNEKFQTVNQICVIYAIGIAFLEQLGYIYKILLHKYFPDFIKTYQYDAILLGTLIINQLLGVFLFFIITSFIKKIKLAKKSYGFKKYFANISVNTSLMFIGSCIGLLIEYLIYYKFSYNKVKPSFNGELYSNIFLNFFVTCIGAPISEEFIFRKFLVDRLSVYSKSLACFASGIIFGIAHSNFGQFFGTMFVGWALAYAYIETGNILISISYHMIINTISTILIKLNIASMNLKTISGKIILGLVAIRLINIIIGIIILIKYRKKIKISGEDNRAKDKWKLFKSYGMLIFFIEGIMIFSTHYITTTSNVSKIKLILFK